MKQGLKFDFLYIPEQNISVVERSVIFYEVDSLLELSELKVFVFLQILRKYIINKLDLTVENQMWTLPKYRELLFIR